MTAEQLLALISSPEFAEAVAELAAETRAGHDLEVEEMAARLNLPLGILVTAAGLWFANETGKSFTIYPQKIREAMQ